MRGTNSIYFSGGKINMDIGYIWSEEQFREDNHIVYRVRSLNYPNVIALIKVGPYEYTVYKGEYDLKFQEVLMLFKIGKKLADDYVRYSW